MISRSEGYRRSAGKGPQGVAAAQGFLRAALEVTTEEIAEADDNYRLGDLRTTAGTTLEVKSQSIDPSRYPQNFVEVFEVTDGSNAQHLAGFDQLAELLDLEPQQLSRITVHNHRTGLRGPLGRPLGVSVSIQSFAGSSFTIYVNPGSGRDAHLYLYDRAELLGHIRDAAPRGFNRGKGRSNDDTCSVQVALAKNRWSARLGYAWRYTGDGNETTEVERIRHTLLDAH